VEQSIVKEITVLVCRLAHDIRLPSVSERTFGGMNRLLRYYMYARLLVAPVWEEYIEYLYGVEYSIVLLTNVRVGTPQ
jgi:hypothetical protein